MRDLRRNGHDAGKRFGRIARTAAEIVLAIAIVGAVWQAVIVIFAPPPFMLPPPLRVVTMLVERFGFLGGQAAITFLEILLGLVFGILLGTVTGLVVGGIPSVARVLTPILVVSQTLPVFAIAPLLVLWFGFGLASKVVMATIIIYFPITSAFADGLRRTDPGLLDLAHLWRASRWQTLALIMVPAALPALVSGIRVAAVFAPIGAVVGEWVGASQGLGFVMLQSNARMQTDTLFAALVMLAVVTLALRIVVDQVTRRLVFWVEDDAR
ncbi:putative aliphatic sulfonates transport permease protein SsuC [Hartmannibacter diazotrophicus]|uniref:Putative aliphatic sulfonates transport permease protein SsuC n=1 Tax=Hartmannibacter diazotrophicus TaxID=1482074 RepID=A0A2C9D9X8_9HYPH|nr:ABC transporter permease [Hartmannibacter diazotrophicus]SON57124.1 putative aliphatic sulfonates transport permease protein SsuC [Hartmannibacter diazotrophicus]